MHVASAPAEAGSAPQDWTRQAALIVAFCFVLNMVDGMDVLVLSYVAPALQRTWAASPAEFSIAFSAGLAGMAVGGLVIAPMADRFGRRRMVVFSLLLMTVAIIASSMAASVAELSGFRFFVGIGIGTVLACIAAIAARVAPDKHRNFAVGVLQAGYPIGAMISGFVTAWALPRFGWQHVMIGTATVSALCVPLVLTILPARLPGTLAAAQKISLGEIVAGERKRSSILLWISTICGFMALYFITSWIAKLAIEAGLPETQAIIASAIYNFGAFSGTFAMSLAGTRYDIRKISWILLALTAVIFLIFGGITMPLAGVLVTAYLMGVALQGGFNALYPIAARVYPDEIRATGIGWAMGIGRIGAFTGPLIGGWALAAHLPLVAVFGIFCIPLLIAAASVRTIRFA
ncbi:MFS transporter [Novosphingobium flavum]|uniref:MFS transporter n=1 Tax=Novosphingobium flavum TaxID=1778672 RepID=A0A7X1FTT7_9SPHN|nr:MFS transporter [Novosphingobium flavum]MBC2666843.1 MFS transporter [Novosphingobium flavum]